MSITVYPFWGSSGGAAPESLADVATTGSYTDLINRPSLGAAAALSVGTTAGTVAAGDDQRIVRALQPAIDSYFAKANPDKVAWAVTGANSLVTSQALVVEVNGLALLIAAGTAITVPASPVAGMDYAIWCRPDGSLEATANHVSPPVANARRLGGYHYAPGGNAPAEAGGGSTPAINPYSCWDLKWRPAAPDPRGMTLVGGGFWCDIYLLNTTPNLLGTSAHGAEIADGSSPPKIPAVLGGDGSADYGSLTWFEAMSVLGAYGKRAPTSAEFMVLAFGVTEASGRGSDPVTTGLDAPRTSRWGVMQATGSMYTWSRDLGGPYGAASWAANAEGRGNTYQHPNAAQSGGSWSNGAYCGSRCSYWSNGPSASYSSIGARGLCDHVRLV
jgi:hypothetical protein